ncbi:MAG: hypothetical protein OXB93_02330, partial [Cytophagales bacterium]|nr:hypothetical protein [Cytophagales bacterium]
MLKNKIMDGILKSAYDENSYQNLLEGFGLDLEEGISEKVDGIDNDKIKEVKLYSSRIKNFACFSAKLQKTPTHIPRKYLKDFAEAIMQGKGTKEKLGYYNRALWAFYSDEDPSRWRLSYIEIAYKETPKGRLKREVTSYKRRSFVLGGDEPVQTAKSRLQLIKDERVKAKKPEAIAKAFSVSALTEEFYKDFEKWFKEVEKYFSGKKNLSDKDARARALQLSGKLTFLWFLQRKEWLSPKKKDENLRENPSAQNQNFLINQLKEHNKDEKTSSFHQEVILPLFYDALGKQRKDSYFKPLDAYIPFLNGGLFDEKAREEEQEYPLPNYYFKDLFKIFSGYNFTVHEASSEEAEVAVDPEMLGKIFENLMEKKERKKKGAFYTPQFVT